MENKKPAITAQTAIQAPIEHIWKCWTTAADIMQWNNPTDEWHTPRVEIDLKQQGHFLFRMETKDGSIGFDHAGIYDTILPLKRIEYTVEDGRRSIITFTSRGNDILLSETFEPEASTPIDMQMDFCQGVLNNFKNYAERRRMGQDS